ncbi:MAG: hypothetical protein U0R51_04105 [Solirubrobacterales bacterium]
MKGFRPSGSMIVAIVALIAAVGGTAYAAAKINGKNLVNDTVTSKKIKDSTLKTKDFSPKTKTKLKGDKGDTGAQGPEGPQGPIGPQGPAGNPATYNGANWSIIDRNTEGSPVGALRAGPSFGTNAGEKPPLGVGSLGLETADGTEKVAFGNQVDFAGDPVSGLDQVGFSYFVTGEDLGRYAANAPNITLEIDPSVASKNYTSMVYVPPAPANAAQQWVNVDADADAGGGSSGWWFSNGAVAAATNCGQGAAPQHFCSLDEAQQALVTANDGGPAAAIGSIAIAKGKDYQFQGAADALRINNEVFDFEPFGVSVTAP